MRCFALCCLGLILSQNARAGEESAKAPVVFHGARIYTAAGAPIESGILIMDQGKIRLIGAARDMAIQLPKNATIRDLTGKVIIPGMVDTHSHIGIYPRPHVPANSDGNEMSGPVQSALRAIDAVYPDDPGIRMAPYDCGPQELPGWP